MHPSIAESLDLSDASSATVALVADTHGQLDARVADLAARCDAVVHAGDVGGRAVLAALTADSTPLLAVRGNNDVPEKWPAGEGHLALALPAAAQLLLPGGELALVHADAWPAAHRHHRLRALFPEARAVAYGHSHRLAVDDEALPWLLNPGAAGRSRTFGGPSCLLLRATFHHWEVEVHRFSLPVRPLAVGSAP